MPKNKKAPSDEKYRNERLKLMDRLLCGGQNVSSRSEFIHRINNKLNLDDGISDASFDKDLKYLREIVEKDSNGKVSVIHKRDVGYYYSDPNYTLFPELVSPDERYLLEAVSNLLQVFKGTSLETQCADIFKRILSNGIHAGSQFEKERDRIIQFSVNSFEGSGRWIERLLQAILKKEALEIQYKNMKGRVSKKIISPYALKNNKGKWFFVAHDQLCDREEKTNVFAVDSILSLEYSNKLFFQDDFDINHYFKYSLGIWHQHDKEPIDVVLEFNKENQFEDIQTSPLHGTQTTAYDEVRKILTVHITVYNTLELEMLIQQYGSGVKVISPQILVDQVKLNLKAALEQY